MMANPIAAQSANSKRLQGRRTTIFSIHTVPGLSRILGLIAVLAIATSCLFFWRCHDFYFPDSSTYVVPASNILAGHGFVNSTGYPETERTPGYSLLILPFLWTHLDLKYLVIFQHLLRALIVLGTTVFAFEVTKSRRTALLTGVLLSLDLPLLESANSVLTEILFTTILAIVLLLLWKESGQTEKPRMGLFAAGLLAGAAVLIRPVNVLFFLPAAVYLLLARRSSRLRAALSFCLAFIILPLAWAIRNYRETGDFTVSTISGKYILLYSAAGVLAINDPGEFTTNLERRQAQLRDQACGNVRVLYEVDCSQVTIPQESKYYSQFGRTIIWAHPFAYAKVTLRGDAEMILGGGLTRIREITGASPRTGLILMLMYTVPEFCLASIGLLILRKKNKQLFTLIALVILYFLAISGGPQSDSRFRVPIIPLYALAAAIGLNFGLRRLFAKNELTGLSATERQEVLKDRA